MINNKKGYNQHKKQSKAPWKAGITLGLILVLAPILYFHGEKLLAQVDYDSQQMDVVVTAEVKLDCTSPTHMFVNDECAKLFTDPVAEKGAVLQQVIQERDEVYTEAEGMIDQIDEKYNEKFADHAFVVCQLNLYLNKMVGDPCEVATSTAGSTPEHFTSSQEVI